MKQAAICFSGKRKSGKSFVCNLLARYLESKKVKFWPLIPDCTQVVVCGVSDPLKEEYAALHGIDAEELKGDGLQKEVLRKEMVLWSEDLRKKDHGYFCRKAMARADSADILIVPDCRRLSDIEFFREHYGNRLMLVRVDCLEEVRKLRGYCYTEGIDDEETECGLDNFTEWDLYICNNKLVSDNQIPEMLKMLCMCVMQRYIYSSNSELPRTCDSSK